MKGDSIVIEAHHARAGAGIAELILSEATGRPKYVLTVAGESGSGKSETAAAAANALAEHGLKSVVLQQDDYFVYPPRSNDAARRRDITWVGPQEVKLGLMDAHLAAFLRGKSSIIKPLVIYDEDRVDEETIEVGDARLAIAEGTYTTLLKNVTRHVFIDRTYLETRAHREKRQRHKSELDPFIDRVLAIEHDIISRHKDLADIVVASDYSVSRHHWE